MDTTAKARKLRKSSTQAEALLWRRIRDRQLAGYKFRRQVPMHPYVLDFICYERRLVIEIDGGQHQQETTYDSRRTEWLKSQGFRVLRFWNNEVLGQVESAAQVILQALEHPHLNPLPSRERRRRGTLS